MYLSNISTSELLAPTSPIEQQQETYYISLVIFPIWINITTWNYGTKMYPKKKKCQISSMMEWRDAACQDPLTWRERERPTHSGPYQRLRRVPSAHIWWQFNDWLDNLSWNFFYLKNWLLLKYFNWPALLFSWAAQLTTDQPYSNQTQIVEVAVFTRPEILQNILYFRY